MQNRNGACLTRCDNSPEIRTVTPAATSVATTLLQGKAPRRQPSPPAKNRCMYASDPARRTAVDRQLDRRSPRRPKRELRTRQSVTWAREDRTRNTLEDRRPWLPAVACWNACVPERRMSRPQRGSKIIGTIHARHHIEAGSAFSSPRRSR